MTRSPRRVLGLDIGGTKLATGVVDETGAVHGLLVEPTRSERGRADVTARLFALGRRSIDLAGGTGSGARVSAVGIACGGPLDPAAGVLRSPPHLPGFDDVPISALAQQAFGVPAFLENDASAAAWGEFRFGGGRGSTVMIYLTLSTGVGGGAVIHGRLHRGATGNGGEFGHITVRPGGRTCSCGRRGCLEAYASGTSIAARAREALAQATTSVLGASAAVTAADVSRTAADGDPLARAIWDETVELLGSALTDLVNVFEPDLVVLGGGVARAGRLLIEPLAGVVARDAMPPAAGCARLTLTVLGDTVGVVGAGAIALDELRFHRDVHAEVRGTR